MTENAFDTPLTETIKPDGYENGGSGLMVRAAISTRAVVDGKLLDRLARVAA